MAKCKACGKDKIIHSRIYGVIVNYEGLPDHVRFVPSEKAAKKYLEIITESDGSMSATSEGRYAGTQIEQFDNVPANKAYIAVVNYDGLPLVTKIFATKKEAENFLKTEKQDDPNGDYSGSQIFESKPALDLVTPF